MAKQQTYGQKPYTEKEVESTDTEKASEAGAKSGIAAGSLAGGATFAGGAVTALAAAGAGNAWNPAGWVMLGAAALLAGVGAGVKAGSAAKAKKEAVSTQKLAAQASREASKEQQMKAKAGKTRVAGKKTPSYAPTQEPLNQQVSLSGQTSGYDDFLARNMS